MKLLISCDMEGISGVVDWEHVEPGNREYEHFRHIMTGDVNAAIQGAFAAGASEVLVTDGHEAGRNLLHAELDPRATLNCGADLPLAIVQGVETGVEAAFFIGYHGRYGLPNAVLSHTWSGVVRNLWLNDVLVGETGLAAAVCGHFGVPVLMISGDHLVCAEATELLGNLETAVVKQALGRQAAACLPLEVAREVIGQTARRALQRFRAGDAPLVYQVAAPVKLTLELMEPEMLPLVESVPGTRRLADNQVEYLAADMLAAYQVFRRYNDLGGAYYDED
jgi:D-amino peptidase